MCKDKIRLDSGDRELNVTLISDLIEPYRTMALNNQLRQYNPCNERLSVDQCKAEGNFDWKETPEGQQFWEDVCNNNVSPIVKQEKEKFERLGGCLLNEDVEYQKAIEDLKKMQMNASIIQMPPFYKMASNMTKREYFAGLAMQNITTSIGFNKAYYEDVAKASVQMADALVKELSKDNGK